MAKKNRYRLLTGKHCRSEPVGRDDLLEPVIYRRGEEIDLTEEEAERLRGRVERIGTAPPAPKPTPEPKPEPKPEPEPEVATEPVEDTATEYGLADLPWSEAADVISGLDTVEEVEAARAEEVAGKGRKGVTKAADERLEELG